MPRASSLSLRRLLEWLYFEYEGPMPDEAMSVWLLEGELGELSTCI